MKQVSDQFRGVLLGTAVGDSLGLPAEGIGPERIRRLWGGTWKHRFVFGNGMISDDTEHALFVAEALLSSHDDPVKFQYILSWKLRWWLLGLPAGIGLATLRSLLKLWLGFPAGKSAVYSAGNGPAMRSGIIGAFYANDQPRLEQFVRASTVLTHSDPKAFVGAMAIAHVAAWSIRNPDRKDAEEMLSQLSHLSHLPEWGEIIELLRRELKADSTVESFARSFGPKGVSGYIFHTVSVAIYAWLRHHDDFEVGLQAVLSCGGDTDTVGAITGALLGTGSGEEGIPAAWINGISEWPRSTNYIRRMGNALAAQKKFEAKEKPSYFWPGIIPRNLFFLVIVLVHGFRRLLPPY